jgi:DNA-directed RNA polymerase subunit M/transcription elongation factor TFIIS
MALPKIDVPLFEINLPLSKKKIKYRPFLVKEEKLLLMAMESGEENTILESIKQIVNNCSLDSLDVDTLPISDLEYFFLQLRAKSVGEVVELQYKCNNTVKDEGGEEKPCGNVVTFDLNITDVVPTSENHSNKIELGAELGMIMNYPNFSMIEKKESDSDIDKIMDIIVKCIDCIYDKDTMYYKKDVSTEELKEFVESLTQTQFASIQKFFETIPALKKNVAFKCTKCGYEEEITIQGIQNFFV